MRSSEQQPIAGNQCPVSKGSREVKITLPYIKKVLWRSLFLNVTVAELDPGTLNLLGEMILQKCTEQSIK